VPDETRLFFNRLKRSWSLLIRLSMRIDSRPCFRCRGDGRVTVNDYRSGGGGQWFAVALPVAAPLTSPDKLMLATLGRDGRRSLVRSCKRRLLIIKSQETPRGRQVFVKPRFTRTNMFVLGGPIILRLSVSRSLAFLIGKMPCSVVSTKPLLASGIFKCLSEKRPAKCVTIIPLNSTPTSQS
jgi:hypothetical protein